MENLIVFLVIALIVAIAIRYIVKSKKNGAACIGCPSGGKCKKCNCHVDNKS